jgi:UDP-N-acetylmuramate dehydrogenase
VPLPPTTATALRAAGIAFAEDAPLARRTYWRVGGPADGLVEARTLEALQALVRVATSTRCPLFVLGKASNLLVSDRGIRGLVVLLRGDLADARELPGTSPPMLELGAGLMLVSLLSRAGQNGWTGIECFAGIPGTVGGAVRMNAGAALGETRDCLVDVDVVLSDGTVERIDRDALQMSYRTTVLPAGAVIAVARVQTTGGDIRESRARIKTHLEHRRRTQPLDLPSCGSTFRNPPGDFAGRLIEASGLKGHAIGGAMVSPKHANFLVNTGGATASDLRSLIEHVQAVVSASQGVTLEREVHFAGEW